MISYYGWKRQLTSLRAILCVAAPMAATVATVLPAGAQVHPPEIRIVYPLGGSAGLTTRVTIFGTSFRNARQIIFDQPGIAAKIVAPDFSKLPAPTLDNDNAPYVVADFTVDRDAPHDLFSFRVISDAGVSSAGKWMVGRELPTIEEKEPNNGISQAQAVTLPAAVNGHIGDGADTDTFAVELEAGKPFVAEVVAAQASSPLDSILTLTDSGGAEVGSNDDFGGPDSLLVYTPKTGGRYFVTIASSLGAGSPVHSYRLSMGVLPLLTGTLPGTLPRGKTTTVTTMGVNVPSSIPVMIPSDWRYGLSHIHASEGLSSNGIIVGVSDLPLTLSDDKNTTPALATALPVPGVANGRFYSAGAADSRPAYFKIHVDAGRRLLIDVQCQDRGGARCDPLLTLYGPNGAMVAESDDSLGRDCHMDRTFDQAGDYVLRVTNLAGTKSPDLVYQLLVQNPPPPGFSITTDTGLRGIGQGGFAAYDVQIARDRWSGAVTLTAVDLPAGVSSNSVVVPEGVSRGLVVLSAAPSAALGGFPLRISATGTIDGKRVTRMLNRASDRVWNGGAMSLQPAPVDTLYTAVTAPNEVSVSPMVFSYDSALGQSIKIHAKSIRRPGYDKPFTLTALGLPDGVTAAPVQVAGGATEADIELKIAANVRPGSYTIVLDAVTANSPQVMLDRVSAPIALTIGGTKTVAAPSVFSFVDGVRF